MPVACSWIVVTGAAALMRGNDQNISQGGSESSEAVHRICMGYFLNYADNAGTTRSPINWIAAAGSL